MSLIAVVLGSAAGGGFPQWNCRCPVCSLAWAGDPRVKPRSQASIAVSANGEQWVLINASPDLRGQIAATPALHPRSGLRGSPIAAVILTGGEIDQVAGLLTLRERQSFRLFATAATHAFVGANPMFAALAPDVVSRHAVMPGKRFSPATGIEAELFTVPGKVPLYLEGPGYVPGTFAEDDTTIGLEIWQDGGPHAFFVPGCAAMNPRLAARLAGAPLVLFDGTLWTDDEMMRLGLGTKTGRRMGHMSVADPDGTIAAFRSLEVGRKIFVHINNSNPMLLEDSTERRAALAAGWEVAHDGMELTL